MDYSINRTSGVGTALMASLNMCYILIEFYQRIVCTPSYTPFPFRLIMRSCGKVHVVTKY